MSEISGALSVLAEFSDRPEDVDQEFSQSFAQSYAQGFVTHQTAPQIVGEIKRAPEDFFVAEHLPFTPIGEGEHIYLHVEKTSTNSGWLAHRIANYLEVDDKDIGFAGRKDRHAVTRQWFSCYYPGQTADWQGFAEENVTLLETTRHRSKLRRGDIDHNAFRLRVYFEGDATEVESRLQHLAAEGFPNYFGLQRFGHGGENLAKADRLLRPAGRPAERFKARGMLISAARSWLFNRYLAEQLPGTDLGEAEGPLIGKARDPQPGEASMNEIEQAWVSGLRKLGAKAGARPLWVKPEDLTWAFEPGAVTLSFSLPAGSYATSLVREIFIVKDGAQ